MKDIAEVLDVSAPSLYNHMSSKQDLLFQIMDLAMDRALGLLEQTLVGVTDVSEQLRLVTEVSVLDFLQHPAEITVCNTEIRSLEEPYRTTIVGKRDAYAHQIVAIVQRGCKRGRFLTEEPRVASFAVLELGNNAKAWFKLGGGFSAETVARMYGEFALRVLGDLRPDASSARAGSALVGSLLATVKFDEPVGAAPTSQGRLKT